MVSTIVICRIKMVLNCGRGRRDMGKQCKMMHPHTLQVKINVVVKWFIIFLINENSKYKIPKSYLRYRSSSDLWSNRYRILLQSKKHEHLLASRIHVSYMSYMDTPTWHSPNTCWTYLSTCSITYYITPSIPKWCYLQNPSL